MAANAALTRPLRTLGGSDSEASCAFGDTQGDSHIGTHIGILAAVFGAENLGVHSCACSGWATDPNKAEPSHNGGQADKDGHLVPLEGPEPALGLIGDQ